MTPELRLKLQTTCSAMLRANDLSLPDVRAQDAVHNFWFGALTALEGPPSPYVTFCLMSGRYEELCLPAA